MTRDEAVAVLAGIIGNETGDAGAAIGAATMFIDIPGWDSVTMAGSVIAAEERFGVRLKMARLDTLETVGDLADLILAESGG